MNATQLSNYNGLVSIVNAVFSDGKKADKRPPSEKYNDITAGSTNIEDAVGRINRMLMGG